MRVLFAAALIAGIALALPVAAGPAPPRTLDGCVRTGPGVRVIQFPNGDHGRGRHGAATKQLIFEFLRAHLPA